MASVDKPSAEQINTQWNDWAKCQDNPNVKAVMNRAVRDGYGFGILISGLTILVLVCIAAGVMKLTHKEAIMAKPIIALTGIGGGLTLIGSIAYTALYHSKSRKEALEMIEGPNYLAHLDRIRRMA